MVRSPLADALGDLAFTPPPVWRARTVLEYLAPDAWHYAYPPSVIVIREPMRDEDSVEALVNRQVDHVATLPSGRVLRRTELTVDGLPAMELAYEWMGAREIGGIQQITTLVESHADGRRIVTSFTTVCAVSDAAFLAPIFRAMLDSVRVGQRSVSAVVPAPDSEPTLPAMVTPFSVGYSPAILDVPMPGMRQRRRDG